METSVTDTPRAEAPPPEGTQPQVRVRSVALNKPLLILGMMLATALAALDATVVATAMPTIVGVLGGMPLYSLVISAFLLTATTTVPVYGKLSDMFGRKPIFMFGAITFILGSALCGLAWDMPSLIAFRALQGLGAGGVLPISLTIIGDLFDVEERARLQGLFGGVWGVSGVLGPLVGGTIVQFTDWRWVFFINVPIGILSAMLLFLYLREPPIHTRQKVDIMGAITLTVGVGLLLIGLQLGGQGGWLAPSTLLLLGAGVVLLTLFAFFEARAEAPILSLELLRRPIIAMPSLIGMLAGAVLIGFMAYVPLLAQGAWGGTPIEAGLIIAPLSISWPVASALSGRFIRRIGFRPLVVIGASVILAGSLLLLLVQLPPLSESLAFKTTAILIASLVTGAGMGMSATSMLIAVQTSVPWRERGIATGAILFFRSMGNTVGAAALGAVLTAMLVPTLSTERVRQLVAQIPPDALKAGSDPALGPVNALVDLEVRDTLPHATRAALSEALATSLWWVFLGVVILAALGALFAVRFPRKVVSSEQ